MQVLAVPCLKDNYAYLIIEGTYAVCVDPSEPGPVRDALAKCGVDLAAIWLTHHHYDHVGGVEGLLTDHPGIAVVAHKSDAGRAPKVTRLVDDGDIVECKELRATIIYNPGHTLGAISYVINGCVFTGDTLFGAGCGRVFEGTMEMMHASLQRLAALPPETKVYFGHEYTASNLRYAAHAEPNRDEIRSRAAALTTPSTPSTIADELATNPFLLARDVEEFGARRREKDTFR
jgi:hydroxyacylglutathione hydrolase